MPEQKSYAKMVSFLENATVITPLEVIEGCSIAIEAGKIAEIRRSTKTSGQERSQSKISVKGKIIIPGMIDIHTHGLHGGSAIDSNIESIRKMSTFFPKHGVTGFLPTTVAEPKEMLVQTARVVNELIEGGAPEGGARVLGLNLEGPFISRDKSGAQPVDFIRDPSFEEFKEIYDASKKGVKLLTVAPELNGSLEFIRKVKAMGVTVSAGHSNATYEQMTSAIDAGIKHATHTFNAMREFKHRDPGMLAAILTDDRVTAELIADNIHVHEGAMKLLIKAKGSDKVVLISDSLPLTGMPDGSYKLMGFKIQLRNGVLTTPSGQLAGSAATLEKSLKVLTMSLGIPLVEAVKMASTNPARILKVDRQKGSIEEGKDADLVILNKGDLSIDTTIIGGSVAFKGNL